MLLELESAAPGLPLVLVALAVDEHHPVSQQPRGHQDPDVLLRLAERHCDRLEGAESDRKPELARRRALRADDGHRRELVQIPGIHHIVELGGHTRKHHYGHGVGREFDGLALAVKSLRLLASVRSVRDVPRLRIQKVRLHEYVAQRKPRCFELSLAIRQFVSGPPDALVRLSPTPQGHHRTPDRTVGYRTFSGKRTDLAVQVPEVVLQDGREVLEIREQVRIVQCGGEEAVQERDLPGEVAVVHPIRRIERGIHLETGIVDRHERERGEARIQHRLAVRADPPRNERGPTHPPDRADPVHKRLSGDPSQAWRQRIRIRGKASPEGREEAPERLQIRAVPDTHLVRAAGQIQADEQLRRDRTGHPLRVVREPSVVTIQEIDDPPLGQKMRGGGREHDGTGGRMRAQMSRQFQQADDAARLLRTRRERGYDRHRIVVRLDHDHLVLQRRICPRDPPQDVPGWALLPRHPGGHLDGHGASLDALLQLRRVLRRHPESLHAQRYEHVFLIRLAVRRGLRFDEEDRLCAEGYRVQPSIPRVELHQHDAPLNGRSVEVPEVSIAPIDQGAADPLRKGRGLHQIRPESLQLEGPSVLRHRQGTAVVDGNRDLVLLPAHTVQTDAAELPFDEVRGRVTARISGHPGPVRCHELDRLPEASVHDGLRTGDEERHSESAVQKRSKYVHTPIASAIPSSDLTF